MRLDATCAVGIWLEDIVLSVTQCTFYEPTVKCILESLLTLSIATRRDINFVKGRGVTYSGLQ